MLVALRWRGLRHWLTLRRTIDGKDNCYTRTDDYSRTQVPTEQMQSQQTSEASPSNIRGAFASVAAKLVLHMTAFSSKVRSILAQMFSSVCRWQVLTQQDNDVLLEPPRRRFHGKLYKSLRASGGAGLARLAALRRGATLAPWRVVREHRKAWLWAQRPPGRLFQHASSAWRRLCAATRCVASKVGMAEPSDDHVDSLPGNVLCHSAVKPYTCWRSTRSYLRWRMGRACQLANASARLAFTDAP